VLSWIVKRIKKSLTKTVVVEDNSKARRVRITEEEPGERFVLIVALMIIFFVGLAGLEVVHMVWMGTWNDTIFNGIMLVVGTIVGAVWGRTSQ
jgi:uncharacterized membrane protein